MKINIDFRLLDISLELGALEDYLDTIERQIDHIRESDKLLLEAAIKEQNLKTDDPEWLEVHQNYEHRIDFLLPHFFRGPFLISLYAVYETAVTEIARLIQKRQSQAIALGEIRADDFLNQAKKYYKHILHFDLCDDNAAWQQIIMFSQIRNALAHTNGRHR